MPPDRAIEPVDFSGDEIFAPGACLPRDQPDQCRFDSLEEREEDQKTVQLTVFPTYNRLVILAISAFAHRDQNTSFPEQCLMPSWRNPRRGRCCCGPCSSVRCAMQVGSDRNKGSHSFKRCSSQCRSSKRLRKAWLSRGKIYCISLRRLGNDELKTTRRGKSYKRKA
jgi:hypothetical protein